jgi:predicted nucleotidyltransferase component of viral defense system
MILHDELRNLATEWGLREDIIEKDYVLGWVLWAIGADPVLSTSWVSKGGTCLKKCFLETYRFSEDLDFTVVPEGPVAPEEVGPLVAGALSKVYAESGIEFSVRQRRFASREKPLSAEARIYYRGPRQAPNPGSIKLDLTKNERVVQPPVLRPISHPYSDHLPEPGVVRTYAFEKVFAEKIRAMAERCRPSDLYDIVNLFHRGELRQHACLVRQILAEVFSAPAHTSYGAVARTPWWHNATGQARRARFPRATPAAARSGTSPRVLVNPGSIPYHTVGEEQRIWSVVPPSVPLPGRPRGVLRPGKRPRLLVNRPTKLVVRAGKTCLLLARSPACSLPSSPIPMSPITSASSSTNRHSAGPGRSAARKGVQQNSGR